MRVYMPRFYVHELERNLRQLETDVAEAASLGAALIMFPEVFLTGYRLNAPAQQLRERFSMLSAAQPQMLCIFGTITEDGRNRMLTYFGGRAIAQYDKVHLFLPNREEELWTPGTRYVALEHNDWRIGMVICNDVRFPEQATMLRQQCSVNMLAVPALWPWQRDHVWATLLRARAIECGAFVLGCCVAGVDNGKERFDGAGNYVFDPLGNPVYPKGRIYEIDEGLLGHLTVNTREQYRDIAAVELMHSRHLSGLP